MDHKRFLFQKKNGVKHIVGRRGSSCSFHDVIKLFSLYVFKSRAYSFSNLYSCRYPGVTIILLHFCYQRFQLRSGTELWSLFHLDLLYRIPDGVLAANDRMDGTISPYLFQQLFESYPFQECVFFIRHHFCQQYPCF